VRTYNKQTRQIQASASWQSSFKLITIAGITLLSACAQTTPNYDSKFGEATRATLSQQIANPDAGNNTNPVKGIDGRAAKDAIKNYQKSFNEPETSSYKANVDTGSNLGN